ncbi:MULTISPECIES: endopeptidase La [unclassified Oceanispirochaeta]|uniref:endopeptidase La n=1 Tax=unclassified Oceanispirochaeta TaxID=2635722 RepID=UPI000E0953DB|nr:MULTISPECIES: endopeptidase La [unclassified Oceanispirochaeta]MBF9018343.1 endopeptidase La [Oceanispirochaeta sp. M2]NPD74808.1 endopeptidase La [Oceanispirochaeta sp. M1]RDG29361.1 endopeptidase La [Oceanispirochaeta sp. M1]
MRINRSPLNLRKPELPVIILPDTVIFPYTVAPFFLTDAISTRAVDEAMRGKRDIFLAFQKEKADSTIQKKHLYSTGTVAHILQVLKLPDGNSRLLVEGRSKGELSKLVKRKDILMVQYKPIQESREIGRTLAVGMETLQETFYEYTRKNKKITKETKNQVEQAQTPEKVIGIIASQLTIPIEDKIALLEIDSPGEKLSRLSEIVQMEIEKSSLKHDISGRVRKKMEKTQKEYFLNEQLKEINKELGNSSQEDPSGAAELESRINEMTMPEEVKAKALKEVKRLSRLQPMSPESGVLRTYLEWLVDIPWSEESNDRMNLARAARVLDEDHYNLKKAKDRILDYIAVRQIREKLKGPILCFVGPPGTGKTSLGRSVARALNREFVRISLGGIRDEAEIRGHRKTYVGALPGKIIQSIKKAGTTNPVFLLDEIDKMSSDFRGDPSAALLEVLDPEQNGTFTDHYLELSYDLSSVMFITTANSLHNIPRPLLDRMEVIEIPGYTEIEKARIARGFIIPKQLKENGMENSRLNISDDAVNTLIRNYTMESGVRNLERQIGQVIRKITREAIESYQKRSGGNNIHTARIHKYQEIFGDRSDKGENLPDLSVFDLTINGSDVLHYLGNPPIPDEDSDTRERAGLATGMAWTEVGGRVLPVEVSLLQGEGKLILTGKLGDVMKESAQIALSYLRANAETFGIDPNFYKEHDIHIHVPEGAIPKDGPSAGITMTAALLSALKQTPLISKLAMTGEITLTDRLLPIGGVKEKVLAAHRNKCRIILLPEKNRKDQEDLPQEIRDDIRFIFSSSVKEALGQLFPEGTF